MKGWMVNYILSALVFVYIVNNVYWKSTGFWLTTTLSFDLHQRGIWLTTTLCLTDKSIVLWPTPTWYFTDNNMLFDRQKYDDLTQSTLCLTDANNVFYWQRYICFDWQACVWPTTPSCLTDNYKWSNTIYIWQVVFMIYFPTSWSV